MSLVGLRDAERLLVSHAVRLSVVQSVCHSASLLTFL